MDGLIGILVFLVIGALAGWLAGILFKGSGFGLLWNIIIGIVGGIVGGWLFGSFFWYKLDRGGHHSCIGCSDLTHHY